MFLFFSSFAFAQTIKQRKEMCKILNKQFYESFNYCCVYEKKSHTIDLTVNFNLETETRRSQHIFDLIIEYAKHTILTDAKPNVTPKTHTCVWSMCVCVFVFGGRFYVKLVYKIEHAYKICVKLRIIWVKVHISSLWNGWFCFVRPAHSIPISISHSHFVDLLKIEIDRSMRTMAGDIKKHAYVSRKRHAEQNERFPHRNEQHKRNDGTIYMAYRQIDSCDYINFDSSVSPLPMFHPSQYAYQKC